MTSGLDEVCVDEVEEGDWASPRNRRPNSSTDQLGFLERFRRGSLLLSSFPMLMVPSGVCWCG